MPERGGTDATADAVWRPHHRGWAPGPLYGPGSAPAVTLRASQSEPAAVTRSLSASTTRRALPCSRAHPTRVLRGRGRGRRAPPSPTYNPPGSADLRSRPAASWGTLWLFGRPERGADGRAGGPGLLVQNYDSPAGEPPAPVRLRKNVCYVVLGCVPQRAGERPPVGPTAQVSGARSHSR